MLRSSEIELIESAIRSMSFSLVGAISALLSGQFQRLSTRHQVSRSKPPQSY
jgi:hypothetical protein